MKTNTITAVAFLLMLSCAVGAQPQREVVELAGKIKNELPEGWRCVVDRATIGISREQPVTLLYMISLPPLDLPALLAEYGEKTDYIIVLHFRPRLSARQLAELKALRRRAVSKVQDDPKHSASSYESRKYLLPEYFTPDFSVYCHRTDDGPRQIYPESAAIERDRVLATIGKLMKKY